MASSSTSRATSRISYRQRPPGAIPERLTANGSNYRPVYRYREDQKVWTPTRAKGWWTPLWCGTYRSSIIYSFAPFAPVDPLFGMKPGMVMKMQAPPTSCMHGHMVKWHTSFRWKHAARCFCLPCIAYGSGKIHTLIPTYSSGCGRCPIVLCISAP